MKTPLCARAPLRLERVVAQKSYLLPLNELSLPEIKSLVSLRPRLVGMKLTGHYLIT